MGRSRTDMMHMVAFLMMPTSHHHGAWRHPETELDFDGTDYYTTTARILEDAKWDMLFMPDVLTVYGNYRGGFETTVRHGGQGALSMDPVVIASCVAAVTERIGLGVTQSASFIPPYLLARSLATLDLVSGGRAAWNVVMSVSDAEAQNFGMETMQDRQQRYDRGDEVVELVQRLWASWEPDAIVRHKTAGVFADPAKVHYADFDGTWVKSRGPLGVPRSKQGSPVIMQAGSSARGKEFAARWGEVVFTLQHTVEDMQRYYAEIKAAAADAGRDPDHCRVLPAVQCIVGSSESEAREKLELLDSLIDPEVALATMSLHVGQDLSFADPNAPVDDIEVAQGSRGSFDVILQGTKAHGLTLREAAVRFASSELTPQLVGTGAQIADQMEAMFTGRACDGFVVTPTHVPGCWRETSAEVIPELQRRGLFRTDYAGSTLRSHFGLPH
ncbi:MAG: dibenzothiophene desulfurization enzyme [Ilumatobacteraceae bacterium]|nr:dibenzothiophene desulfurization enzyme [Ilumatobacteraceae bacterium]